MLLSEYIAELQKILNENGDMDCATHDEWEQRYDDVESPYIMKDNPESYCMSDEEKKYLSERGNVVVVHGYYYDGRPEHDLGYY